MWEQENTETGNLILVSYRQHNVFVSCRSFLSFRCTCFYFPKVVFIFNTDTDVFWILALFCNIWHTKEYHRNEIFLIIKIFLGPNFILVEVKKFQLCLPLSMRFQLLNHFSYKHWGHWPFPMLYVWSRTALFWGFFSLSFLPHLRNS